MSNLIFVYGTLKTGEINHGYLMHSEFVIHATTAKKYLLYDLGAYPCLVKASKGKNIRGEVWRVDDEVLECLDRLEGVKSGLYERARISLLKTEEPVWGYLFLKDTSLFQESGESWSSKNRV